MHNYSYDHQLFELDGLLSTYSDEPGWEEDDFDPEAEFEIEEEEETDDKDEQEEDDDDDYDDDDFESLEDEAL